MSCILVLKKYPKERIEECHWYNITSDNVIGFMAMKYYQLCNRMDFHQLYSELSTYLEEIEQKHQMMSGLHYICCRGAEE